MRQSGFTIVETVVAVAVAGVFMITLYSIIGVVSLLSSSTSQAFEADQLSYTNMRTFADGRSPTWFTCPTTETDPVTVLSSSADIDKLPSPVTQTVVAEAVYGCSGTSAGLPIRVTSTVTYGPNNVSARNATYVTY